MRVFKPCIAALALLLGAMAPVSDIRAGAGPEPGAGPPAAEPSQPPPDPGAGLPSDLVPPRARMLDRLYERLAAAPSPDVATSIVEAIDRLMRTSESPTIEVLLARATAAIEAKRFDEAMRFLDTLLELQPDFAEGWNRRAFVRYLQNEPQRALGDIRRTLALEPRHLRALEGMAQILRELGEKKAALAAYKKLLELNPHADGVATAIEELTRDVEGQGI